MVFPDGSWALSTIWHVSIDDVSSDICDDDRKKRDYAKSISKKNTVGFKLVQSLSKSNSPAFSIVVLCYGKIGCPE
jgi:hypothetical protein